MKTTLATLLALSVLATAYAVGPARADADDEKWIAQCVSDNKDQGQTPEVIKAYCTCMNDQMSTSETKSITQWEKTHKKELEACATKAGWKGK
jgi:hypothetical protein